MIINSINTESITPVEYNHMHDGSLIFRKYRENFDFGLTVEQYYFNKDVKDKKTNYNTQYTLTELQPLSTILELKIPYTELATNTFTTTVKFGNKYLKTDFSEAFKYTGTDAGMLSSISSTFVDSTEFTNLSTNFFFTFTLTTIALSADVTNYVPPEERVIITQEYNSNTYYLTAASATDTGAWFVPASAVANNIPTFRYNLENNKVIITNSTPAVSALDGRLCNHGGVLSLSATDNFFSGAEILSACIFDINRFELTKNYKSLPNNYVSYISSYNTDTVDLNTSTITEHISNNYFFYSNNYNYFQKKSDNTNTVHADLFPLKNQATLHEYYATNNHFNSEPGYLNRVYEKIHSGTKQQTGLDKIGVSYNIGTYDIAFKPNKLTYFTTPSSLSPYTVLNIKDSKIQNLGAIPGDNPLMSDKVFKRRMTIKNNNYSNNTDPTYLCSWLSGNSDGETKWVDRYYNPSIKDFTGALSATSFYKVVTAAGAETTETFDVSSSLTFEPNNDYMFYHVGVNDYGKLFEAYNTVYNEASAVEYLNYKGVPQTVDKVLDDDELILDGEKFGRIKTNAFGDFSTSFWLHTKDNTQPFAYQILGNYFEDGFGIFNTDLVTPNIILPVNNENTNNLSKLLFLNNDFEVYDEIVLMDGVNEINIKAIGRKDNFSEFYVLGENNVIYVFNSNNNLVSKIENLKDTDAIIDDFEVGEDRLHVLFNPVTSTSNFFTYNYNSNTSNTVTTSTSADTKGEKGRIVRRDKNTTVYKVDSTNGYGNEISFDSQGKAYTVRRESASDLGNTQNYVQKDSQPLNYTDENKIKAGLGVKTKVNGVIVDDEDNIIVLHDNNIISILDNNRILKRSREFCNLNNYTYQQTYLDIICDFENGVYKKYILLIQEYNDGFRLTKLNDQLQIVHTKKFYGRHPGVKQLGNLALTKSVTSFYYLRNNGANKNRLKVVLKTKPKYSSSGVIPRVKNTIDFDLSTINAGYNHFFINVSLRKGYIELFVNGRRYQTVTFAGGSFALDNVLGTGMYIGTVSTPFFLTFANRLQQPKKYFINNAKIKGFKLYNKTMSYFDMLAHYNYHLGDKDLIWSYPIGQRTYIDTIDKLAKFSFPEKINNDYKVNITNTDIADEKLKDKIKERLQVELKKITPYYDKNKEINIT
tara:strand:- start:16 stop:3474 length:3459 start_codon:yes stop_codon:yes gene_type:complete